MLRTLGGTAAAILSLRLAAVTYTLHCKVACGVARLRRSRIITAVYGFTALLVVTIGELGLLDGSRARQMLESIVNIHLLFALLLCGVVLAGYTRRVGQSTDIMSVEVRELSRHLSRTICLLLYIVIGVRQIVAIAGGIRHGGAVDFNLFDGRFSHGQGSAAFDPKDDFQMFLASGLLALAFARGLAFRLWLGCVDRTALPAAASVDVNDLEARSS
jgi:hypothetical protein